ncbi:hypothetical protein IV203_016388 [Nitzschia inconspicua]|uniref:Uncharacterized protein n=1 Tax=Nitzschia inconspicua TaxID=303405 RepID=A0A9K3PHL3_9STRA|nr:hypothetical protein IV203_016388 [Nitzschia inconspicua]
MFIFRQMKHHVEMAKDAKAAGSSQFRFMHQRRSKGNDEDGDSDTLQVMDNEDTLPPPLERLEMSPSTAASVDRRNLIINSIAVGLLGASGVASYSLFQTSVYTPPGFRRLPRTQFIAALGDPKASQGSEAKSWGLWMEDPGPRGVWLRDFNKEIVQNENHAPAGWTYNNNDWWLEEHGIIMEAPKFPLQAGRYLVTGGRLVTTGLTIDSDGRWKLDEGTLYDVTHLPCRSARYQPLLDATSAGNDSYGTPLAANPSNFPVAPGALMPEVNGCNKQDYAVLFVVGKAEKNA